jgi:hypothetical protein
MPRRSLFYLKIVQIASRTKTNLFVFYAEMQPILSNVVQAANLLKYQEREWGGNCLKRGSKTKKRRKCFVEAKIYFTFAPATAQMVP